MARLFGTDGVRGLANQELTPELAFALGRAGAYVLIDGRHKPQFIVGKDTRRSGDMLEAALTAGILSVGGNVVSAGVVPTPAVAYLTGAVGADAGIMISASHNPAGDNGIKFFSATGHKLPDATEDQIEALLNEANLPRPTGGQVGQRWELPDAAELYVRHLEQHLGMALEGLRVVVDTAYGAAYQVAPEILRRLGAKVDLINADPTGTNINANCGSTHPEGLQAAVLELKADIGLAFDGDADRLLAVDEKGRLVDGDQILAILALWEQEKGSLKGSGLVATFMSNMGLELVLREHGLDLVRAQVGDRYVLEELQRRGWNLGGEQSGHIINLLHNTTGDGLSTALQLLNVLMEKKQPLSELAAVVKQFPQLLLNVAVASKTGWEQNDAIQWAIVKAEQALYGKGRVLVRPSGTEPVIRVMVEGEQQALVHNIANQIVATIKEQLG